MSNTGPGYTSDQRARVARAGSKIKGFAGAGLDAIGLGATDGGAGAPPPPVTFFLLLESGSMDRVLLETGDRLVKEDG